MRAFTLKILFVFLLVVQAYMTMAQPDISEYSLKAVFLERFTRFVQPIVVSSSEELKKDFVLVVLGDSPFENYLDDIYKIQKIKDRPVKIYYITSLDHLPDCDLLFVCEDQKRKLKDIMTYLADKTTLTISDTPGFAQQGVMINMILKNNKIRCEINTKVANAHNLKFDRILLSNAIVVE